MLTESSTASESPHGANNVSRSGFFKFRGQFSKMAEILVF